MTNDTQTSAYTPKRIVTQNLSFSIPIYQRLFAWTPEEVKILLEDLKEQFDKDKNSHYYVGLLTITSHNELVDGQQRFTCMMLIGIVMQAYANEWKQFLTTEDGQTPRLTFKARKADEEYILDKIKCANKNSDINEYMEAGIKCIQDFMEKSTEKRCEFAQYVYEHMAFFVQKLPTDYSGRMLNKYFEAMNSTGRNLDNHEILKVELLSKVQEKDNYERLVSMWNQASQMKQTIFPYYQEEKKEEYRSIVNQIKDGKLPEVKTAQKDEILSILLAIKPETNIIHTQSNDNPTKYRSFLTFTDLLLHTLYLVLTKQGKTDKDFSLQRFFKPEKLRDTFKEYEKDLEVKNFIEQLYKYRIILDWALLRIDGEGDYDLALANSDASCLKQYEAMLFASTSRYTYYQWVPFIMSFVEKKGDDESALLAALKGQDNSQHPYEDLAPCTYPNIELYYFRRLDYYLWENIVTKEDSLDVILPNSIRDEDRNNLVKAVRNYHFRQYNSIEHLYPRNEKEQSDSWKDKEKNCFGNLALVSTNFNSTQGNDALALKFSRIESQILGKQSEYNIDSIKLAIMYYSAGKSQEGWTYSIAQKHEEKMMEVLKVSYNKPIETEIKQ